MAKKIAVQKRKIGTIIIATAVLENADSRRMFNETLFRKFCPFYINVSPDGKLRAFIGFCDDFAEIGPKEQPPRYVFNVSQAQTGERSITFTRYEEAKPKPDIQSSAKAGKSKEKRK